jgi:predicted P-loop ATPase
MADLGMNSSILSYLARCKKQSCWQSSTGSSTTSTDRIRLSRGVRPWKSSSNGERLDHPSALIGTGAAKGVTSPAFDHDQGRREELLGLAFRLTAEIGAERGLQLMQEHSPAVNDLASYFNTEPTKINAGSIWPFLREHYNVNISRTSQKQVTANPVDTAKPVKAQAGKLVNQLPQGWEADASNKVVRRKLKSGDLAGLLAIHVKDNLRFNELTLYVEYNNKTVTSSELEHFYIQLSEHGYTIPKGDAPDCLVYQAKKHSYHPVREYLNHIKNDNDVVPVDISNLASKYLNSTNPLHDTMLRKTLIGAVARVMDPGCKFDTCLVLVGATGIGKSTFFKTLASPAWFCDTAQEKDKDFLLLIHSTWIYELAELETKTGKKDPGEIKALLSASTDKFRAPYAAAMEDRDRKSIFVATCNRRDFLRDETGSRRYWVIPVPNAMHEKIDVSGLLENRDAIWKAAAIAYANGEKPFLNIQDELSSEQENKAYEPEDIWLAPMEHWLNKLRLEPQFTTAQALIGAGLRQRDHLSSDDQRRAAHVLRELGCVQGKHATRVQGKRARLWEVGTDDTDQTKGSVPAETDCTGTDPSVLAQITDKKAKTFKFLSTDGTEAATPAPPREKTHRENKKDLCICANTLEPAALQSITAGTDPQNELCQAPSSVPELSDLGSGYDAAADGDDPHWGARL